MIGKRIGSILSGLAMILFAILVIAVDEGYYFVLLAYLCVLTGAGIRYIHYYFTMAKFMTGGRYVLYRGILMLDVAVFAGTLNDVPPIYIMVYLIGLLAFSGAVDIFRAFDSRRVHARWKMKLFRGVITLLLCILAVISLKETDAVTIIYCLSLISNGGMRIINALRPAEVFVIQ